MKKYFLIFGGVLAAALVFAGFKSQTWMSQFADQKARELLATPVAFSDLSLHLQEGSVILRRLNIYHPDRRTEKIGEVEEMTVRLRSLSELFRKSKEIQIVLKHPKFIFTTTRTGDWELANRIPLMRVGAGEARLTPFNIEKISVEEGDVEFQDGRVSQPPTVTRLTKVNAVLDHFRRPTPQEPFPVEFQAQGLLQNSAPMELKGEGDFLSPKISFSADLKVQGFSLPPYAPYYEAGLPVYVRQGVAAFSAQIQCQGEILHGPIHASVSGLKVELKKNKLFEFVADDAVNSLKDKNGNVPMDLLVTGNLRRPQFIVLTDFEAAAKKGVGEAFKGVGRDIKEGTKSGWRKFKGAFSK
jgi:uncharacterized protein involved in outer membrane biogenesis